MLTSVLRANAASCLGFGGLFLAIPTSVAAFIGTAPEWVISAVGAILVLNGVHLVWASLRPPTRELVAYFSTGDFLWVAATAVLLISGVWIVNTAAVVTAIIVALMVGAFGVLQLYALRS
ncbi:hypothetical protein MJD09_14120 [bacterium]|nr:hypothetical protein [bacterium]